MQLKGLPCGKNAVGSFAVTSVGKIHITRSFIGFNVSRELYKSFVPLVFQFRFLQFMVKVSEE
jgi:hypothetical protein